MRVLFTVVLTVVVLAVALPAVAFVGVDRSETAVRDAVDEVVDAARRLDSANDALADETATARRVVTLDLPTGGFASARLVDLTVQPPGSAPAVDGRDSGRAGDDGSVAATRISWRVEGGRRHVRQVDGIRLRPAGGDHLALEPTGTPRVVLKLVLRDGRRVVTVSTVERDR